MPIEKHALISRQNGTSASALSLAGDLWAFWRSGALLAAIELDIFTAISGGLRTARDIATSLRVHEGATAKLLDALVALEYLSKAGESYLLDPVADTFLVRGHPLFVDGTVPAMRRLTLTWSQLTKVLRTGRPAVPPDGGDSARSFFAALVKSIFPMSYLAARAAVGAIPKPLLNQIMTVLDIGAGAGAWSIAFAEALPEVRVTALDFPEVLHVTREFTRQFEVQDRYEYLEGDLRQLNFGTARFDLAILANVTHCESTAGARLLIEKAAAVLHDNGLLLLSDFIANDDRSGPALAMLFGLNMLINATEGEVFTARQYSDWLRGAGFRQIQIVSAPEVSVSPLILAYK